MQSVKDFMEADHDRLDGIFTDFQQTKEKDMQTAKELFEKFKAGLERHIYWEEEILFPVFEEKTGQKNQGPTFVMRQEHTQIRGYLNQIKNKLENGNIETEYEEKGMLNVLKIHNEKEEKILYPWIDQTFTEQDIKNFFDQV